MSRMCLPIFVLSGCLALGALPADAQHGDAAAQAEARTQARTRVLLQFGQQQFERLQRLRPRKLVRTRNDCEDCWGGEMHEASYAGFSARFYRSVQGKVTLFDLSTQRSRIGMPLGLSIGQSPEQVMALMGVPDAQHPQYLLYSIDGELPSSVHFGFARNRLNFVHWSFAQPD